jgi:hypothetical protein
VHVQRAPRLFELGPQVGGDAWRADEPGVGGAGVDGEHPDAARAVVECGGADDALDRALAGGVGGVAGAGVAGLRGGRADDDAAGGHARHLVLDGEEHAAGVGEVHVVPLGDGDVVQWLAEVDAGVVERDVEPTVLPGHPVDEGLDLGRVADVGPDVGRLATRAADLPFHLAAEVLAAAAEADPGPLCGEQDGGLPADAGGGAGDDHDLVREATPSTCRGRGAGRRWYRECGGAGRRQPTENRAPTGSLPHNHSSWIVPLSVYG